MSCNFFIRAEARQRNSGFTLIEVLLGVMILALGLLGLGAVFPLVVKQQRSSQDSVVGSTAAKGAETYLRSHFGMSDPSTKGGWSAISRQVYELAKGKNGERVPWSELLGQSGSLPPLYPTTGGGTVSLPGTLHIASTTNPASDVYIKSTDRLLPAGVNGVAPLFVWDMVPSLANPVVDKSLKEPSYLPIRVTVFIRRIDSGIRVSSDKTLLQEIANGVVVPVAADADGYATLDGKGVATGAPRYSTFKYPEADPRVHRRYGSEGGDYNVLTFSKASKPEIAALRQIGQQLVDTEGNVYTVIAFPDESEKDFSYGGSMNQSVVISPGIPNSVVSSSGNLPSGFQFLCTPQIPAAVTTFLVRP